ncbi:hypothetical protein C8Q80DRAFT_169450 [Daedaleopsis nitida]|nr:hypothetical protein C8Q80DRAFT_169450 [Daedaleopsis nitida]
MRPCSHMPFRAQFGAHNEPPRGGIRGARLLPRSSAAHMNMHYALPLPKVGWPRFIPAGAPVPMQRRTARTSPLPSRRARGGRSTRTRRRARASPRQASSLGFGFFLTSWPSQWSRGSAPVLLVPCSTAVSERPLLRTTTGLGCAWSACANAARHDVWPSTSAARTARCMFRTGSTPDRPGRRLAVGPCTYICTHTAVSRALENPSIVRASGRAPAHWSAFRVRTLLRRSLASYGRTPCERPNAWMRDTSNAGRLRRRNSGILPERTDRRLLCTCVGEDVARIDIARALLVSIQFREGSQQTRGHQPCGCERERNHDGTSNRCHEIQDQHLQEQLNRLCGDRFVLC